MIAHPAASALVLSLNRLTRYQNIRTVHAHIFEPASEQDKRGAAELHSQTSSLLAFRPLEKKIFDAQLSFNLLPKYGEEAESKLISVEQKIERHVATLLNAQLSNARAPMPSLRVIAAPVFHGYSISLWVEFESAADTTSVSEALASAQIEVRTGAEEPPNNVGASGQSGLIAGDIRIDSNNPRAVWIWIVADNLRLMADGAAELLASAGAVQSGAIQ